MTTRLEIHTLTQAGRPPNDIVAATGVPERSVRRIQTAKAPTSLDTGDER